MAKAKKRLDQLLHTILPEYDIKSIQSWIMQGKVLVEGERITKPGTLINENAIITNKISIPKYVSRAGLKLEKALHYFSIDVKGLVVLDAGISTGGFTDCLLQHGARTVYGIDVGYGNVHEKIRNDTRLVCMEKTNLRFVQSVGEPIDLITLDLSFISIITVMPAVIQLLKNNGTLIALIKPQFEAPKHKVGTGGIIRDDEIRNATVNSVISNIKKYGFEIIGIIESPITGTKGNKEFLAYCIKKAS